jgi:MFS transporter, PHS family, inorganic phosphate transporter
VYYFTILWSKNQILYEDAAIPIPVEETAHEGGLPSVDRAWRIVVGFGTIPALISLYFRLTIPETPRYQHDTAILNSTGNRNSGTERKGGLRKFINHFKQWKHGKQLLGTAGSWFMLDIAFYGLGLNNSIILQAIGYAKSDAHHIYATLHHVAVGNLIIQCAGTLPGYWFSVAFIDIIGRKRLQLASFAILTMLFVTIGFAYHPLYQQESKAGFIVLFVMCQFFMNFGANTTTFIVPGELFPTEFRTTAHGISAACGKFGAVMAQVVFSPLKDLGGTENGWMNHLMQIFAAFMLMGFFCSFLIPETMNRRLEENETDCEKRVAIHSLEREETRRSTSTIIDTNTTESQSSSPRNSREIVRDFECTLTSPRTV